MDSVVKLKSSIHLAVVLVAERLPLNIKKKTHTKFEICAREHARRMNTERDTVVIHMLPSGAGGSESVCFKEFSNLCTFVLTFHYRVLRCVCVCFCGLMHFLFATQTWQALEQRTDSDRYSIS